MNELFEWRRFGLLIRNNFISNYRRNLIVAMVVVIVMALNMIPAAGLGELRDNYYYSTFEVLIFLWGTIQASFAFLDLLDKKLNEGFLLLPASTLEKTIARYLHRSVFFVVQLTVLITVAAFVIEGINLLLFGRYNGLFNPFDPEVWRDIGIFMVIQPIFFLGGAWFKRSRWFKTVLVLFVIGALLGLLLLVTCLIFFAGSFQGLFMFNPGNLKDLDVNMQIFSGAATGLKILFFGVMPPFCLIVTYLRVKETQVSHGI